MAERPCARGGCTALVYKNRSPFHECCSIECYRTMHKAVSRSFLRERGGFTELGSWSTESDLMVDLAVDQTVAGWELFERMILTPPTAEQLLSLEQLMGLRGSRRDE